MSDHLPTYSQIIDPETYNRIIDEHLYIRAADLAIRDIVRAHCNLTPWPQVVEIGSGPARLLPTLAAIPYIHLTGVDHDPTFVEYGQQLLREQKLEVPLHLADIMSYQHPEPVEVFVSEGFHHHITKGEATTGCLQHIYHQLQPGGLYVCGDEFLPFYADSQERLIRAIIWYSHVIAAALRKKQMLLAREEAKTLIDDLSEGTAASGPKDEEQIEWILEWAGKIDKLARNGELFRASLEARAILMSLRLSARDLLREASGNPSMDLSRGDFKIDHRRFVAEVEEVGFQVIGIQSFGPIATIGGMGVYVMRKP